MFLSGYELGVVYLFECEELQSHACRHSTNNDAVTVSKLKICSGVDCIIAMEWCVHSPWHGFRELYPG